MANKVQSIVLIFYKEANCCPGQNYNILRVFTMYYSNDAVSKRIFVLGIFPMPAIFHLMQFLDFSYFCFSYAAAAHWVESWLTMAALGTKIQWETGGEEQLGIKVKQLWMHVAIWWNCCHTVLALLPSIELSASYNLIVHSWCLDHWLHTPVYLCLHVCSIVLWTSPCNRIVNSLKWQHFQSTFKSSIYMLVQQSKLHKPQELLVICSLWVVALKVMQTPCADDHWVLCSFIKNIYTHIL